MKTTTKYALTAAIICLSATSACSSHNGHMKWGKQTTYQTQESTYHLTTTDVSRLQRSLKDKGFYNGAIDGVWGTQTTQAVQAYQNANDLQESGTLSTTDLQNLGIRINDNAYENTTVYKTEASNGKQYRKHVKAYKTGSMPADNSIDGIKSNNVNN